MQDSEREAAVLQRLKNSYLQQKMHPIEARKHHLRRLHQGMKDLKDEYCEAVYKDLRRGHFFSSLAEVDPGLALCEHTLANLDRYTKDVHCDPSLLFAPAVSKIHYEPLGVALIMNSWNFPNFGVFKPLVTCIAAGNCAVIKPSELAPASANVIQKIIDKYMDPDCFQVIQGYADVAKRLNALPFDIMCFTGSTSKGKLVARAAAEHLVPCILELGGKSPYIWDNSADFDHAANRACFGKFSNAGQICIGVDYVIVHESKLEQAVKAIMAQVKKQYGVEPGNQSSMKYNPDVGGIINKASFDRIKNLIETSDGQVLVGGVKAADESHLYIPPTVIKNPSWDSKLMAEEIFGPVLPIVTYIEIGEVVERIQRGGKPLVIYYSGSTGTESYKRILSETSSGALVANDTFVHPEDPEIGFGGVGTSGYGRHGGYESFKQWSNAKAVVVHPQWNFWPANAICAPYDAGRIKLLTFLGGCASIRQNKVAGRVARLIFLFVLWMLLFGTWGRCDARKQVYQAFIEFLQARN